MENTESRVMSFDEFVKHEQEMAMGQTEEPMTEPTGMEVEQPSETEPSSEEIPSMEEPTNPEPDVQVEEPIN